MEPQPENESLVQKHYLLIVTLALAAVAIYGIITMQLLVAAIVGGLIAGIALLFRLLQKIRRQPSGCSCFEAMDDGSIIIAAALFAFIGMAISVWVVWAVALAVLFHIQQLLARIERHLAETERPGK